MPITLGLPLLLLSLHFEVFHDDHVGLAYFLFFPYALILLAKPHPKNGENRSSLHSHWIYPQHSPIGFKQLITNGINHHVIFTSTKSYLKMIAKDNVILRTNITSPKIPNISHQRWVVIRWAKEWTHMSMSIPFWNFLIILKLRVQYEGRTSPDRCFSKKNIMIRMSLGEQFYQS